MSLGIASFEEPTSLFRSLLNFLKKTGASIVGLDLFEDGKLSEAGSIVFSLALTFFIVVFVIGLEKIKPEIDKKGFKQAMKDLELHRKIREHTKHWFRMPRDWFENLKGQRRSRAEQKLPPIKEVPKVIAPEPIVIKPVKESKPILFPKINSFFENLKKNATERAKERAREERESLQLKKKIEADRLKAKKIEEKSKLIETKQKIEIKKPKLKPRHLSVDDAIKHVEHELEHYDKLMTHHKGLFSKKLSRIDNKLNSLNKKSS